jgi:hypothetical protein
MTDDPYQPAPMQVRNSLNTLFHLLCRAGYTPLAARALLSDAIQASDTETEPALPRGWRLVLHTDGVAIETADTTIVGDEIFILYRKGFVRPAPVVAAPPPAPTAPATDKASAAPPTPDVDAANEAALVTPEQKAILWLTAQFRQHGKDADRFVKRDEMQAQCAEWFNVGRHAFQIRVWPQARVLARLPPRAPGGRRKSSRKP